MSARLRAHIRQNVVGYVAIFLFATGGVAYATHPGGANTISSDDIINGAVKSADVGNDSLESQDVRDDTTAGGGLQGVDLRPGSVGGSEVADGALTAADIADTGSLGTAELNESNLFNDDSLTGVDINEAALGKVPDADTLDGLDASRLRNDAVTKSAQCLNLTATPRVCEEVSLNVPVAGGHVYLSAWWRWTGTGTGQDSAFCEIKRGSLSLPGGPLFGQSGNEHNNNNASAIGSLIALDRSSPAGNQTYSLTCEEIDGDVSLIDSRIVAIRLSG